MQPNLIAGNWNTENVFLVAADQWGPKTVDGGSGMLTKEGNCSQLAERSTLSFVLRWTSQTTITFSGPWVSAPSLIVISDSDQYFKISYRRFDSKSSVNCVSCKIGYNRTAIGSFSLILFLPTFDFNLIDPELMRFSQLISDWFGQQSAHRIFYSLQNPRQSSNRKIQQRDGITNNKMIMNGLR